MKSADQQLVLHKKLLARNVDSFLKERRPFRGRFFDLTSDYLKAVVYEEIFYLIKELNFSFSEAYSLPIGLRKWFLQRNIEYMTPAEE